MERAQFKVVGFMGELRELFYAVGRKKTDRIMFRSVGDAVEILAVRHIVRQDVSPDDIGHQKAHVSKYYNKQQKRRRLRDEQHHGKQ